MGEILGAVAGPLISGLFDSGGGSSGQQQIPQGPPPKTKEQQDIDKLVGTQWQKDLTNPFKFGMQDPYANTSSFTIGKQAPSYTPQGNFGMAPAVGQRSLSTPIMQQQKKAMTFEEWAKANPISTRTAFPGLVKPITTDEQKQKQRADYQNYVNNMVIGGNQQAQNNSPRDQNANRYQQQPGKEFNLENPMDYVGKFRQQDYAKLGIDQNTLNAMQQKADALGVPMEALPEMKSLQLGATSGARYWENLMNGGLNINEGLSKDYETKYKQNYQAEADRNYAVNDLARQRMMNKTGVPLSAQVASNSAQLRQQNEADRAAMNNLFMTNENQAKQDQMYNLGMRNTGASNLTNIGQYDIGNNRSDQAANIEANRWKQEADRRNAALGLGQMQSNFAATQANDQYNHGNQMSYDQMNEARRQALEGQSGQAAQLYNALVGQQKTDYDKKVMSAADTRNQETSLNRNDALNTRGAAGNWSGNMANQALQAQQFQNNAIMANNQLAAQQAQQQQAQSAQWGDLLGGAFNNQKKAPAASTGYQFPSYLSSFLGSVSPSSNSPGQVISNVVNGGGKLLGDLGKWFA